MTAFADPAHSIELLATEILPVIRRERPLDSSEKMMTTDPTIC